MSSYYSIGPLSRKAVTNPGSVMSTVAVASQNTGGATAPIIARRSTYPGIQQVLKVASKLVTKYTGREDLRALALRITSRIKRNRDTGLPDLRNIDRIAEAIYWWITGNINYVRDPWDVERIQSPDVTLRQKAGDCDDHAVLSASLLQSLGIQTGFRVVSRSGGNFDHIYTVFKAPSGWKSFDTTVAKYPGFEFNEQLILKSKYIPNRMPRAAAGLSAPAPVVARQPNGFWKLLIWIALVITAFPVMGELTSKLAPHE